MIDYQHRRGRHVRPGDLVEVYRNVSRSDGPWFSVRASGVVVAHVRGITLYGPARFAVGWRGRQRVLESGVKNVHAFVRGYVDNDHGPLHYRVTYEPKTHLQFCVHGAFNHGDNEGMQGLRSASTVTLGPNGVTVSGVLSTHRWVTP